MYKSSKRDRERELSPIGGGSSSKRSRSSTRLGRYDMDDDMGGGGSRRPPPSSSSYRNNDDYLYSSSRSTSYKEPSSSSGGGKPYPYKVLCISSLHPKASDELVRETIYREFKRYGDISVKVVVEPDERVAYVYFRCYEDAREAKGHSKSRLVLFDRTATIEAAYESSSQPPATAPPPSSSSSSYPYRESSSRERPEPYTRRSPMTSSSSYDRHGGGRGGGVVDESGGRYGSGSDRYGPPPPHHHQAPIPPPHPYPGYKPDYSRRDGHHGGHGGYGPPPHHHPAEHHPPPPGPYMRGPPPPHHFNHNPRYNQPRHHGGGGGPPAPSIPPQDRNPPGGGGPYEIKKDKFPNYLHHIAPEDDPLATRTLFAGNLEVNITDEELRRIFTRYGVCEDIDIKRPPPGTGNAYAFVRFLNLDMAAKAKQDLSGQYIGKFQCKIGYGKANPTNKVWIGGLGLWTTLAGLEHELDRFGSIKKIEWVKGEGEAYVTFETIDAAAACVKDLRGYPLGGPEKRVRTDFADAGGGLIAVNASTTSAPNSGRRDDFNNSNDNGGGVGSRSRHSGTSLPGSSSPQQLHLDLNGNSGNNNNTTTTTTSTTVVGGAYGGVRSLSELLRKAPVAWTGALILKNSSFASEFYLVEGSMDGLGDLMKDEDEKHKLRITQRLRLEESKLDDVSKRLSSASSFGIFVSVSPGVASPLSSDGGGGGGGSASVRAHPLKNLVAYLRSKDAAGVITLNGGGVLYAFPPSDFGESLLARSAPVLKTEPDSSHLTIVVIRGPN